MKSFKLLINISQGVERTEYRQQRRLPHDLVMPTPARCSGQRSNEIPMKKHQYPRFQQTKRTSQRGARQGTLRTSFCDYNNYSNMAKSLLNRPFYSCELSYLAMNASEAGGDLVLIETSLLFSCKMPTSQHKNNLIYTTKAVRSVSKQGHLQPRCHSKARSLRRQL